MALAIAAPLGRTRWLVVAQAAGFAVCATLAIGWSLESLTSTRRLAMVGIASLALCFFIERSGRRSAETASVVLLAAASVWVLWRLLAQKEPAAAMVSGVLVAAYVAWQACASLKVSADPVRGTAAAVALGFGAGGVAILGASAVLGIAALAAGFAACATLTVQVVRGAAAPNVRSASLPSTSVAALVPPAAVMTGELPWYALVPLLAVAPAALLAWTGSVRWRAAQAFFFSLVPAVAAVALAWFRPD